MSDRYTHLASETVLANTTKALESRGFTPLIVENLKEAKAKVLELIPSGSEVFTSTSRTLEEAGIESALNDTGHFKALRPIIIDIIVNQGDREQARRMGAAPDYIVGSVHAITEAGEVMVVSATGSQLAPYVNGAAHVIWVVSTKKIVKDLTDARQRVEEHIFPLENVRSQEAYGIPSSINKELVFHRETPGRITVILVKEDAGF